MTKHRATIKLKPHINLYKHMCDLGLSKCYIELIENYPCNDVYELKAREGYHIRERGTLNSNIEGITIQEYRQDNK